MAGAGRPPPPVAPRRRRVVPSPPRRRGRTARLGAMVAVGEHAIARGLLVHQDRAGRVGALDGGDHALGHGAVGHDEQVDLPDSRSAQRREHRGGARARCALRRLRARPRPSRPRATAPRRSAAPTGAGTGACAPSAAEPSTASTSTPGHGPRPRPRAGDHGDSQPERHHADLDPSELTQPSLGPATRDEVQPPEGEPRRAVQQRGDRSPGHAGDDAGGQAPHHHQSRDRHREQVGGSRRDGDGAERAEEHRGDAELGGDRDGQRVTQAGRSRERARRAVERRPRSRWPRTPRAGSRPTATSSGSTTSSPVTARAMMRTRATGRPTIATVAASAAMADARSTDGSKRVITPKRPITATVAASRGHNRRRRSTGPARARTKATFWPDTANRWVSPAPWNASARSAGCARSSPRTRPVNKDRWRGSNVAVPATRVRRRPLASRATGCPGRTSSTARIVSRPLTWRLASQLGVALDGRHLAAQRHHLPGQSVGERPCGGAARPVPPGGGRRPARPLGARRTTARDRSGG